MDVMFFSNGDTAVFNEKGKQMTTLQKSYIELFGEFLQSQGIDPLIPVYTMPNGKKAHMFYTSKQTLNWRIT